MTRYSYSIIELEREKNTKVVTSLLFIIFKGTVSRDFRPSVFSLNCTPGSPESCAKTVLHIDSNSRGYSIFLLDNDKLQILFYSHGVGKITYDRFFEGLLL
jgi:hypothetical protein